MSNRLKEKEVVKYLIKHENVPEDVAKNRTKEFLKIKETRESLYDLVNRGGFRPNSARFLGFVNAYDFNPTSIQLSQF